MTLDRLPITAIVLTKNEENGIATTLRSLTAFDEVIVVDSTSGDRTVEIARDHGASVIDFVWDGRYPKKKQWSLEHAGARNRWILLLDADEMPSTKLVAEMRALRLDREDSSRPGAFDILLSYRFAGRVLRHGHRVTKRSLLDTEHASFPQVDDLGAPGIREVEGHYQPEVRGGIGRLQGRILHDDKDPVRTWFDRHNRYSDWEAYLRLDAETRAEVASKRTLKGRVFDKVPLKPLLFFTYSYIARAGFLDGRAGFDYAVALSTYYWQIGVKVRELRRSPKSGSNG